ncbi:hypothetical protein L198_02041 [Cryptococcus wingfieldii CBS 7118]|uniref:Ubiquitin-like domain-containing protein n=1 Tax=Cryptococcus wingfieldii CBS 7118 TaxID=1295528 RepID=A0A1E3JWV2_9TREE|nr:hypothetical protein L198_02041 [Cryptococcus wingfieldii CBS 7118]ODO05348.1 hypothetical protein L198_02041 [Cryptococcus wingfieldii CBS 7118]
MRFLKPTITIKRLMSMLMITDRVDFGQGGLVIDDDEVLDKDLTLMQCGIEDMAVLKVLKIEKRPSQGHFPKQVTVLDSANGRKVSIPNTSLFTTVAAIRNKSLSMLNSTNSLTLQIVYKGRVLDGKTPITDLALEPDDVLQLVYDGPITFEVKNIADNPSPYTAIASLRRTDSIDVLKDHLYELFKIPVSDQKLWINARPVPDDHLILDNLNLSEQKKLVVGSKTHSPILCKTSNGDMPLFVSFNDKVGSLRSVLRHHKRVDFSTHDLVYNGVVLSDDSRTLGSYGVDAKHPVCAEKKQASEPVQSPAQGPVQEPVEQQTAQEEASLTISIRNLMGEYREYKVKPSMGVNDLKIAIEARENVAVGFQRLMRQNVEIKEGTLKDCGIVDGDKVVVVRRLKARESESRPSPEGSSSPSKRPRIE